MKRFAITIQLVSLALATFAGCKSMKSTESADSEVKEDRPTPAVVFARSERTGILSPARAAAFAYAEQKALAGCRSLLNPGEVDDCIIPKRDYQYSQIGKCAAFVRAQKVGSKYEFFMGHGSDAATAEHWGRQITAQSGRSIDRIAVECPIGNVTPVSPALSGRSIMVARSASTGSMVLQKENSFARAETRALQGCRNLLHAGENNDCQIQERSLQAANVGKCGSVVRAVKQGGARQYLFYIAYANTYAEAQNAARSKATAAGQFVHVQKTDCP